MGPGSDIAVHREDEAGVITVSPTGDVDLSRSPSLRVALRDALAVKPGRVIVDLAGVEYMDSSGIATLVEALQIARRGGTRIILCALRDRVRSVFEIARLDTVFTMTATRDEARRA